MVMQHISSLWNWASPVWLVVTAFIAAYLVTFGGRLEKRSWWFAAAMAALVAAFVSPVGVLADGYMFSAHMIQHLVLLLLVPLFFLMSLPRERMESWFARPGADTWGRLLAFAPVGWVLGLSVMWIWHVPTLCTASLSYNWLGLLRDSSFVLAGIAFWWPVFAPVRRYRLGAPGAAMYLFTACVGCTLLGIYLTFTPISVCPVFAEPAGRAGLLSQLRGGGYTAAMDQRLGGLLMWVPPCVLYAGAIVAICRRWYAGEETESRQGEAIGSRADKRV
jgi:putative membrane protein